MGILNRLFGIFVFGVIMIACATGAGDKRYFNGEITLIDDISEIEKLEGIQIFPEGAMFEKFVVYDSLIIFYALNFPESFFSIYSLNTYEHLGDFCKRGRGPNESLGLPPIYQLYEEDDQLKTLLLAPNNAQLMLWNISASLQQNETIFDTIIPYTEPKENIATYIYLYRLSEDTLLARLPADYPAIGSTKATLPVYHKRTIYSNEQIKEYTLYNESIPNGSSEKVLSRSFFWTTDYLKPDRTKVAQAMLYMNQINILDLVSGEQKGYRIKGAKDFSVFKKNLDNIMKYYSNTQADDQFIYTLYSGKPIPDGSWVPPHLVYVFDWNGNLVRKLDLGREFTDIALDRVNNILYAANRLNGDVYYYNLNDL